MYLGLVYSCAFVPKKLNQKSHLIQTQVDDYNCLPGAVSLYSPIVSLAVTSGCYGHSSSPVLICVFVSLACSATFPSRLVWCTLQSFEESCLVVLKTPKTPFNSLTSPWKWGKEFRKLEVGAGSDVTPRLSTCQLSGLVGLLRLYKLEVELEGAFQFKILTGNSEILPSNWVTL